MKLFATDLDRTLIYSYQAGLTEPCRCVEQYQGRDISFMSEVSLELLRKVREEILCMPVTTRSIEQYQRIFFDGEWKPEYALVCNGGILLHKGEVDEKWYEESLQMIASCQPELKRAITLLETDPDRSFEIRKISGLFIFTKSENPGATLKMLKEELDGNLVDICSNYKKIYVLPKQLNKGKGIERLRHKLNLSYVIAAGDSEFDISMLEQADLAFYPETLRGQFSPKENGKVLCDSGRLFSEELLERILTKLNKDK